MKFKSVFRVAAAVAIAASVLLLWGFARWPRLNAGGGTNLVPYFSHIKEATEELSIMAESTRRGRLWGVITTILEINPAVVDFVSKMPYAALVVVGDQKTNHSEWQQFAASRPDQVFYLAPNEQHGFQSIAHIPWNHFGRKSIGFLYAMRHGAEMIYDFDDDNHLDVCSFESFATMARLDVVTNHHIYNPYPFFEPVFDGQKQFLWPRGQPLQWINDPSTYTVATKRSDVPFRQIVVLQSLANHDPDVDAIYRMTQPLPISFRKSDTIVIPPKGTFTPWNAQAVLISKPAFFGMLLPTTVTGRVSDIWRSYITSRLLWETDYRVGFASPIVTQLRNPHSYQKDLEEEDDLYHKADLMLATLASWTSDGMDTLDVAYLDLITTLVAKGILGMNDLKLATAWVADLKRIEYEWPSITTHLPPFTVPTQKVVDQRANLSREQNMDKYATHCNPTGHEALGGRSVWKSFAYLIQGSSSNQRLPETTNRDVFWLFSKPNRRSVKGPFQIYKPNTTWAEGRNALLSAAQQHSDHYEYFIFLDADMLDQIEGEDQWTKFETWLLRELPSVGYMTRSTDWMPVDESSDTTFGTFNVDANVNAFHRSTVGTLIPYDSALDDISWYFSQDIVNVLVATFFRGRTGRLGWNVPSFHYEKNRHSYYPRSKDWDIALRYMEAKLPGVDLKTANWGFWASTAVCLTGHDGATNTTNALKTHVLDVLGADFFEAQWSESTELWFDEHVPKWRESSKVPKDNYLGGLPGFDRGHGAMQLVDRYNCLAQIRALESARGTPYNKIAIGRKDLMWMADHPDVQVVGNECWIPCTTNDWGGYCDHWAICGREGAEALVEGPLEVLPWKAPPLNAERHLKEGLAKRGTRVKRGSAAFFRSCQGPSVRCLWIPSLRMAGKPSGNQLAPWQFVEPEKPTNNTKVQG